MPIYRIFVDEIAKDTRYKDFDALTLEDAKFKAEQENEQYSSLTEAYESGWELETGITSVEIRHDRCQEILDEDEYGNLGNPASVD